MQLDTTFNIYIAKRYFYIARLKNDMFRPLYRPSSGCALSYYKQTIQYTRFLFFLSQYLTNLMHKICFTISFIYIATCFCTVIVLLKFKLPNMKFLFISVINQIDAQNFCFTINLFHTSTCFEYICSSSGGQNCITQPLVSSHL